MFEAADTDGDGKVSLDEFVAVFGKAAAAQAQEKPTAAGKS